MKELVFKGQKVVLVDKVDMVVVVIFISCFNELSKFGLDKVWIEFGVRINKRWLIIHDSSSVLGIKNARLLFWYAFTGCGAVSGFGSKGKLSTCTTCRVFVGITPVFEKDSLHSQHTQVQDEHIRILERFTCLLYRRTPTFESMNECRRHLFTKQGRRVDTIPPTKDALLQQIRRAAYQAKLVQSFISLIKFCLELHLRLIFRI